MNIRPRSDWTQEDLDLLDSKGIEVSEASRQMELFRTPPQPTNLVRPCTVGDGILRLLADQETELEQLGRAAVLQGLVSKFVPASGAATRMFRDLIRARDSGHANSEAATFLSRLEDFAFHGRLKPWLQSGRDPLEALLAKDGLDYSSLPKALVDFHLYDTGFRSAFEEHLREAAFLTKPQAGECRVHLTVSPEHQSLFEAFLSQNRRNLEDELDIRLRVEFSQQSPSTDTLAADESGNPFRDREGRLLFRPGGHGSLIENLNNLSADLVVIKNIDNISHERFWATHLRWKQILTGLLVQIRRQIFDWLDEMDSSEQPARNVRRWIEEEFGCSAPDTLEELRGFLNRPIRVCGMVPNTGEPGGGPFWVQPPRGDIERQIVESAQMDLSDPHQASVFESSTHFNPVDMVCSLRDYKGQSFDLSRFVDPSAVFISRKSSGGKPLFALERPGLWNGGMARWLTFFVEVPIETFNPVKTVNDLLRDSHQPASG